MARISQDAGTNLHGDASYTGQRRVTADATTVASHLTARLTGAHLVRSQCLETAVT